MSNPTRILSWFSCGAASAVATKLALAEGKKLGVPVEIAYTAIQEEHPDNHRFLAECEEWFGQKITVLRNEKYSGSIYEVFRKERFLVGPSGAACTRLLKKELRAQYERFDDRQVFGYTSEEQDRIDRFIDTNPDVDLYTPLMDLGLSKADCLAVLRDAGIELPEMYKLGYKNNNCIGCVKGGAGYWNKIRVDFPEVFERMAQVEETLGRTINQIQVNKVRTRISLRLLPPDAGRYEAEEDIECGIVCYSAINRFTEPEVS